MKDNTSPPKAAAREYTRRKAYKMLPAAKGHARGLAANSGDGAGQCTVSRRARWNGTVRVKAMELKASIVKWVWAAAIPNVMAAKMRERCWSGGINLGVRLPLVPLSPLLLCVAAQVCNVPQY